MEGIEIKILSFSATEILPSLLSKTKIQTSRPGWTYIGLKTCRCSDSRHCECEPEFGNAPARFNAGEKVKLVWKQRSQHIVFCRGCGAPMTVDGGKYYSLNKYCDGWKHSVSHFRKEIGIVEITEVFEIDS